MDKPRETPPDEGHRNLKDLLHFGKSLRLAALLLLCIVLPAIPLLRQCAEKRHTACEQKAAAFIDSLYESRGFPYATPPDASSPATGRQRSATYSGKTVAPEKTETFPFDPNRADSLTLRRLGLPPYVVRNLLRYRAKGGVIRTPEKFASIYGMRAADTRRLAPYLQLEAYALPARKPQPYADPAPHQEETAPKRFPPRTAKYPPGTRIDLNKADTTELKRLRGIGSWRARLIVDYRNKLGGYYTPAQLGELPNMPDSLQRSFFVSTPPQRTLNLNRATLKELLRHPYLNYRQCRTLLEHRRKRGPLTSLRPLLLYEEFTENDLKRLEPYVTF